MWKIIGLLPYNRQTIRTHTSEHKITKKNFCESFLEQTEDFRKKKIFLLDEKLWVQKPHPNRQIERSLRNVLMIEKLS